MLPSSAQQPFKVPQMYNYVEAVDTLLQPLLIPLKGAVRSVKNIDSLRVTHNDSIYFYTHSETQYYSKDGLPFKNKKLVQPYRYQKFKTDGVLTELWSDANHQKKVYRVQNGLLKEHTFGNNSTLYKYTPSGQLRFIQMFVADTLDAGYEQLINTNEVEERYIKIREQLFYKLHYNNKNQLSKKEVFSNDGFSETILVTTLTGFRYSKNDNLIGFRKQTEAYEAPEHTGIEGRLDQLNYKDAPSAMEAYDQEEVILSYTPANLLKDVTLKTGENYQLLIKIKYPSASKRVLEVTLNKKNELGYWKAQKQRILLSYDSFGNLISYKQLLIGATGEPLLNQWVKRIIIYYNP